MKKLLILLLSLALLASCAIFMVSCGDDPCTEHTDADENGMCDVCNEAMINPETPTELTVAFTLKDQDGAVVPGVEICFAPRGAVDAEGNVYATSGADGKCSAKLKTGTYRVSADYDVDEIGYYFLDTTEIKVTKDTAALDILMTNNNPNGTERRPYPLSVGDNALTVPAGESVYYVIYRAVNLIANVTASGIKVEYKGAEYIPDQNNNITFSFTAADTNSVELIKITNTGASESGVDFAISSIPGSLGNPFVITALGEEIAKSGVNKDSTVYFTYTSTVSGTLVLTVTSDNTHAAMQNGSYQVSTASEDSMVISLTVAVGDEVVIDIGTASDVAATISFNIALMSAE